jgi:hypothetical protein
MMSAAIGALRVLVVVAVGGGLVAVAVAAQVGADDREVAGEVGRDVAPGEMGLREPVDQRHRCASTPDSDVEYDVTDTEAVVVKARDQLHRVSATRCPTSQPD